MTASSAVPPIGGNVTAPEIQPIRREETQKHLPITTLVMGILSVMTLAAGVYLLAGFNTIPALSSGGACIFTSLVLVVWIACRVNRPAKIAPTESQEAPAPSGSQAVPVSAESEDISERSSPRAPSPSDEVQPSVEEDRDPTAVDHSKVQEASLPTTDEARPLPSAPIAECEPSSSTQCTPRSSMEVDEEVKSTLESEDPSSDALQHLANSPGKVSQFLASSQDAAFTKEVVAKLLTLFDPAVAKEFPDMIKAIALKIQTMDPKEQIGLKSYPQIFADLINDGRFTNGAAILYLFGEMDKNQKIFLLDALSDKAKAEYKVRFLESIGEDEELRNLL